MGLDILKMLTCASCGLVSLQAMAEGLPSLVINEFMASNDFAVEDFDVPGEFDDWFEIYNQGTVAVDMSGMYVTDDLAELDMWQLPDGIVIQPGEFLVFWADRQMEQGPMHVDFKLSAGGEEIVLVMPDAVTIIDQVVFGQQTTDFSKGRNPDGSEFWNYYILSTPGQTNADGIVDYRLYVNEIMPENISTLEDPDQPGDFPDWIELYNASDETIDLGGLTLSNDESMPDMHVIPDGLVLPPFEYTIFILDGSPRQGPTHVGFTLEATRDFIGVFDPEGEIISSHQWTRAVPADVSLARVPDGTTTWITLTQPTPGSENILPSAGEYDAIRINEVMARNESTIEDPDEPHAFEDWIEIHNTGEKALDLSGLFLTDNPGVPDKWAFPPRTTIKPGGFLVIWADDDPEQGPLHTNFKLSSSGETVAMYLSDAVTVVDSMPFAQQFNDISYGLVENDSTLNYAFMSVPTPGQPNISSTSIIVLPEWTAGPEFDGFEIVFQEPNELGFDDSGRLWAGDVDDMNMKIFDVDGSLIGKVGGMGSDPGNFILAPTGKSGPEAIRYDGNGRMFVVDRGGDRVNVYDSQTFEVIGSYQPIGVTLIDPTGLAIDSQGLIYIADQGNDQIHRLLYTGNDLKWLSTFQPDNNGSPVLNKTETLALDESRDILYASSETNHTVEAYQLSSGAYLGVNVTEQQSEPPGSSQPGEDQTYKLEPGRVGKDVEGVCVMPSRDILLISDEENGRINIHSLCGDDIFNPDNAYGWMGSFGSLGTDPGQLLSADGIAADDTLQLIAVADQANARIQAFSVQSINIPINLSTCPGDLDGNSRVDGKDLATLLGQWNWMAPPPPAEGEVVDPDVYFNIADINRSGNVDGTDLAIILGFWGDCPCQVTE